MWAPTSLQVSPELKFHSCVIVGGGQVKQLSLGYEGDLVLKATLEMLLVPHQLPGRLQGWQSCWWELHSSVVLLQSVHSHSTACAASCHSALCCISSCEGNCPQLLAWKAGGSFLLWPIGASSSVTSICPLQQHGKGAHRTAVTHINSSDTHGHQACSLQGEEQGKLAHSAHFSF